MAKKVSRKNLYPKPEQNKPSDLEVSNNEHKPKINFKHIIIEESPSKGT